MTATEALKTLTKGIEEIKGELVEMREFRATVESTTEERSAQESTIEDLSTRLKAMEEKQNELQEDFFAPGAKKFDPTTGKGFSIARAINAHVRGDWSNAPEEKDVLDQCKLFSSQQKGQGMQVDSTGGFAVPENLVPELIQRLEANTVFNAANIGCFEMPAVPGTMKFNRIASGFTAAPQAAEGDQITESTMAIEQIELMPKTIAAYCTASNLLLANNTAGADAWIQMRLARDGALIHDQYVLRGTGNSGQPLGLLNDPDILTSGVSSTVTFDEVEGIRLAVANANGIMGTKMGWAAHPSMLSAIRLSASGVTNVDMARLAMSESATMPLIGYPVYESTQFSATTDADSIVFGAWDMLIIANFSGFMITKSDHAVFNQDECAFRLIKYMDTHRLQPSAFCKAS